MGFENHGFVSDEHSIPGDYAKKCSKKEIQTSLELAAKKPEVKDERLEQVENLFLKFPFWTSSSAKMKIVVVLASSRLYS